MRQVRTATHSRRAALARRRALGMAIGLTLLGSGSAAASGLRSKQLLADGSHDLLQCSISIVLTVALTWATVLMAQTSIQLTAPGGHQSPRSLHKRCAHRAAGLLLALAATGVHVTTTQGGVGTAVAAGAQPGSASGANIGPSSERPPVSTTTPDPDLGVGVTPAVRSSSPPDAELISPEWTPPRPPASKSVSSELVTGTATRVHVPTEVTVRRGDTLWTIVHRHLGPDADVATIARAVSQWHQTNRATIGPDADRLFAGQLLHVPTETR